MPTIFSTYPKKEFLFLRNIYFGVCNFFRFGPSERYVIWQTDELFMDIKLNVAQFVGFLYMERKHCRERRKCRLPKCSLFPTNFSYPIFHRNVKITGLSGNWLCQAKDTSVLPCLNFLCPLWPTIVNNIHCLYFMNLKVTQLWLAKPYSLTNQKLCFFQMLQNIEKSGDSLSNASWYRKI